MLTNDLTMAIDPDATHRRWVHEFEWHLDVVPPLMDALVEATLPVIPVSRAGSRFDKDQITGGGYFDTLAVFDQFDVTSSGAMIRKGAAADVRELWDWVTAYVGAASAWLNQPVIPPYAADLPPVVPGRRPDADPFSARATALVTAGWLIDRADLIAEIGELEEHREAMFQLIRHLRGRYGVFSSPRRRRPELCALCGEYEVRTRWESGTIGPRSVEVKKCRTCGDEQREPEPAPERTEITQVEGRPIRRVGGLTDADRAAFRALVEATKQKLDKTKETTDA